MWGDYGLNSGKHLAEQSEVLLELSYTIELEAIFAHYTSYYMTTSRGALPLLVWALRASALNFKAVSSAWSSLIYWVKL